MGTKRKHILNENLDLARRCLRSVAKVPTVQTERHREKDVRSANSETSRLLVFEACQRRRWVRNYVEMPMQ